MRSIIRLFPRYHSIYHSPFRTVDTCFSPTRLPVSHKLIWVFRCSLIKPPPTSFSSVALPFLTIHVHGRVLQRIIRPVCRFPPSSTYRRTRAPSRGREVSPGIVTTIHFFNFGIQRSGGRPNVVLTDFSARIHTDLVIAQRA